MAVKNMQTVARCVANQHGVRVTGTECSSMQAGGSFQAPILSLPWHPLPGLYPTRTGLDAKIAEDNTATALAVLRTGRSASGAGAPTISRLARTASGTVPSTRSSSFTSCAAFAKASPAERKPAPEAARQLCRMPITMTKLVRG